MQPEEIRRSMTRPEFIPFDVRISIGVSYHVSSPEMTWMSPDGDLMLICDPVEGVALFDVDEVTECVRPIGRTKAGRKAD